MVQRISMFWWIVLFLMIVAAFLRLYRLEDTLMFQGDQGRDAIVVKRIIKDADLTLLGPVTSVGNMYLGPFYYYFMAPFLALSYPNPAGPAYGVALVSLITIFLVGYWGKQVWGRLAAILAMTYLGFNQIAVFYSRFSWNPNIAPLLALTTYWATYLALSRRQYRWLWLSGLSLGLLNQTHYMTLLMALVPVAGLGWAWWRNQAQDRKKILLHALAGLLMYGLTMLPLLLFELRYDALISKGFVEFVSQHETQLDVGERIFRIVREIEGRAFHILSQLSGSRDNGVLDRIVTYGSLLLFTVVVMRKRAQITNQPQWILLAAWLLSGILGTALYSDTVFDHYVLYMLPAVAWLFGIIFSFVCKQHRLLMIPVGLIVGIFIWTNSIGMVTFNQDPGPAPAHFSRLVDEILSQVELTGKYNLALITESKDYRGMNYRYFFEVADTPIQNFVDYDNLDTLIIIDERRIDDPLDFGIYEIQHPGLTQVERVIELTGGPRVLIVR